MFIQILKKIWRFYHRQKLKKYHISIAPTAYFNQTTYFEGYNKIAAKTSVSGSFIGRNTYVGRDCYLADSKIGRFCSIARKVWVFTGVHPSMGFVSSSPIFFSTEKQCNQSFVSKNRYEEYLSINKRSCIIGNDVWIGSGVKIKGGVTIGDGAIIGMGAVVTKDVEPYAIVGGVPAKLIRYRFTRDQIDFLLEFQWWNRSDEWLRQNVDLFEDIEKFIANCSKEI